MGLPALYYRENFDEARAGLEDSVGATVRTLFRRGDPAGRGKPMGASMTRANKGCRRVLRG